MRTWCDWTPDEKDLFVRVHRDDVKTIRELDPSELSEVLSLVNVQMYILPLTQDEVNRVKHILESAAAGFIPQAIRSRIS